METSPLARHEKIAFHFSGGKDSLACLYLLKPYLHKIMVMWVNTGEAFPETLEQMELVKKMCPNFTEVQTNAKQHTADWGFPVDVLPMKNEREVQFYTNTQSIPLQSFLSCCMANLMLPLHEATKLYGATLIIRGQKLADKHKSPVKSGDMVDGFEFWFPIENWTDEEVMAIVGKSELLPKHYEEANTSLDCWSCTAYMADNQWKLPYLKKHHPEKAEIVQERLKFIRNELLNELQFLEVCNGD